MTTLRALVSSFVVFVVFGALVVGVAAAPGAQTLPSKYTVRVKMVAKNGAVTMVPVAVITRDAAGAVTTKTLPAPALDSLATTFLARWKAYKPPASVSITEHIASDTGMRPSYQPHTFAFTKDDTLYGAAVIRKFLEKYNYTALGMSTIKFVEYDTSSEDPPGADDRSSTHSNFRKGATLPYNTGVYMFYVSAHVRSTTSPGPGRVSASNKDVKATIGYDDGLEEIARMTLHDDGRVEVVPVTAAQVFTSAFGTFTTAEDITLHSHIKGAWSERVIPKASPMLLEAYVLEHLEYDHPFDTKPTIDPAKVN